MFSRLRQLRATIRVLIQLPAQLSTVRMLVEYSIAHTQETNQLLRELLARSGNQPATPPTPPLDLSTLAPDPLSTMPANRPKLPSPRLRTDADVVVANRQFLLDEQDTRRREAAQASREGQRIL